MDQARIKLENEILDRMKGRIDPNISAEEKLKVILDAFEEFCKVKAYADSECEVGYFCDKKSQDDFLREFQSYGIIEPLLNDPMVEDIIINGTQPIYVHHSQDGMVKTEVRFESTEELDLFIKKIMVFSGKAGLKKINDTDLLGLRGRVNIVYSPMGSELTITKIKQNPLSIINLIENGSLNSEMAALLWLYVEGLSVKPANILISGGPGSGKTTLLNALLSFIPADQHLVIIEDTFELVTNWIGNVSRLETDEELTLAGLVKNSLRMRPDRVVVGEVRGEEAQDMITAMNTGKYCMGTIHAATVREAILRLQNEPMNVPETLINLIDVFIIMRKIKNDQHLYRVIEEVSESSGLEQKTILISSLWKFELSDHHFSKLSSTNVYRDRLAQVSGVDGKSILNEISRRQSFLEELAKHKVNNTKDVAGLCEIYLKDPKQAARRVSNFPSTT